MRAAVVTAFDTPPQYAAFAEPAAEGADEIVVDVLAAGLHPRVRSQADGSHYTSTDELPLVPGIDGVGRDADGALRYFVLPDTTLGSMAERTVVDARRSVVLPAGTDIDAVAAGMNPAMGSWVALRRRIEFAPGQDVLVIGASGNAGRMAIQVARYLGARRIVATARGGARLDAAGELGATDVVALDAPDELARVAADVDVVLDFLWGQPATDVMTAVVTGRADRSALLSWVQIGSVAGPTAAIPSAALRAARLQVVGSGQGSVSARGILAELPELAARISDGTLVADAVPVPLSDVTRAWTQPPDGARRIVLVP